jgi:hypothetical protein
MAAYGSSYTQQRGRLSDLRPLTWMDHPSIDMAESEGFEPPPVFRQGLCFPSRHDTGLCQLSLNLIFGEIPYFLAKAKTFIKVSFCALLGYFVYIVTPLPLGNITMLLPVGNTILVPRTGLEPARPYGRQPLKLVCLPIPPPRH